MIVKVRLWIAGMMLAAAMSFVSLTSASAPLGDKDHRAAVIKIADSFKKGDTAGAKKAAAAVAKECEDFSELMYLFRARYTGGIGWGAKASTTPKDNAPDGRYSR